MGREQFSIGWLLGLGDGLIGEGADELVEFYGTAFWTYCPIEVMLLYAQGEVKSLTVFDTFALIRWHRKTPFLGPTFLNLYRLPKVKIYPYRTEKASPLPWLYPFEVRWPGEFQNKFPPVAFSAPKYVSSWPWRKGHPPGNCSQDYLSAPTGPIYGSPVRGR